MPHYFFDIRKTGSDAYELQDEEGNRCLDDRMAETEAVGILADMARSMSAGVDDENSIQAHVRTEAGQVIFRAKLQLTTERVQG